MQGSSICISVISVLLCLVGPLQSDPQQSDWSNYEAYDPRESANPITFPQQFSGSNIQTPSYSFQHEERPFIAQESKYFRRPPSSSRYPDGIVEAKYLQGQTSYDYRGFVRNNRGRDQVKEDPANFGRVEDAGANEDEILEKMRILDKLLSDEGSERDLNTNAIEDRIMPEETRRVVRQIRKQKPGFFWTLARITFESINDTKSAIKQISDIVNNTIVPDSATQSSMTSSQTTSTNTTAVNSTEATTTSPTSTTQAPFTLTKSSLQRLIRRNVLGLVRLFNIEWKEALNQSDITVKEFRKDLGNQVGSFLRDNPNAY